MAKVLANTTARAWVEIACCFIEVTFGVFEVKNAAAVTKHWVRGCCGVKEYRACGTRLGLATYSSGYTMLPCLR